MSPQTSKKLIVADPGLESLSGHHAAVLDVLKEPGNKNLEVDIWCSNRASQEVQDYVSKSGYSVTPFFSTEFYGYYFQPAKLAERQVEIRLLASEYHRMLTADQNNSSTTILFHTMDWFHLWALSLAVKQHSISKNELPNMLVLLMFNPLIKLGDEVTTPLYSSACRYLFQHPTIKMYAGDYETASQVSKLLDINECLPVHPCLISGEITYSPASKTNKCLLYCGDAKANKGFNQLPEILDTILGGGVDESIEYVIHYTNTSIDPELKNTESRLFRIAQAYKSLTLVKGFISQSELETLISSSSSMVMNYDPVVYQHKSSGMVWLAAKYGTALICLTDSWLNREADRLGLENVQISPEHLEGALSFLSKKKQLPTTYYRQLFQPFSHWLNEQIG
ncbi:hypothetical protein P7F88_22370 [Vibrio hannami]|uniref:hypothetical protein n=1 Tax=Vibrio hannami TaxID=2717094 RepID=UPI0024100C2B|nr:hypothetical protein [Vibrio hannami]MDG3088657.1 hypothetical protein [Vibrio hannami]